MAKLLIEMRVEMEDGATHEVVADQRDIAKWEVQDFGCPFPHIEERGHLAYRWLAWSALSRRGLTELGWPQFDAVCLEVTDVPEPEPAGDAEADAAADAVDPGRTAPSD